MADGCVGVAGVLCRAERVLGRGAALFARLEERHRDCVERLARLDARQGSGVREGPSEEEEPAGQTCRAELARLMVGRVLDGMLD